jgi:Protein kinase domain
VSSSSPTDLAVVGFRIERELGRGSETVVYEATQLDLSRSVALKLLSHDDEFRSLDWPEHPCAVSLYATGDWEDGRFVAMQMVRGSCLADLLQAGELDPARSLEVLADVASVLDAIHREGVAHGAVTARNVLVDSDGRGLLSDFGLAAGEPTVAADRLAFAALLRECTAGTAPLSGDPRALEAGELVRIAQAALAPPVAAPEPPVRRGRRLAIAAAAGGALVVAAALIVVLTGASDAVPPPERGAIALGGNLEQGGVDAVDCAGGTPSGASQACTIIQTALPGSRLAPDAAGAIRRWIVRGATGELALQVIRRQGNRYVAVARSPYELVPDEGVHAFRANLAVRPGDRIGVQLSPGAAIGVRRGVAGAATARWLGQLFAEPRSIDLGEGSGLDHELLVRADYAPGAKAKVVGQLTGAAARRAPAGTELASRTIEVDGAIRRVVVVRLADAVAVDLFAGRRRLARVPASGADPAGRLLHFATSGVARPLLRWRNPDGRMVSREYAASARTLIPSG